jgi:hypothetical protein
MALVGNQIILCSLKLQIPLHGFNSAVLSRGEPSQFRSTELLMKILVEIYSKQLLNKAVDDLSLINCRKDSTANIGLQSTKPMEVGIDLWWV